MCLGLHEILAFLRVDSEIPPAAPRTLAGDLQQKLNSWTGMRWSVSIAREGGVKMPSFFGYLLWSGAILIPTFLLLTVLFFRA